MTNDIIKIIFLLKGRKKFVKRYLSLLNFYNKHQQNFDLLIITDIKKDFLTINSKLNNRVIFKHSGLKKPIKGINEIFKSILINSYILKNYKYSIFVEDDNFVFPGAILKCKKFLENNLNFISANGISFLYSKKNKFKYLNLYNLPISLQSEEILK